MVTGLKLSRQEANSAADQLRLFSWKLLLSIDPLRGREPPAVVPEGRVPSPIVCVLRLLLAASSEVEREVLLVLPLRSEGSRN